MEVPKSDGLRAGGRPAARGSPPEPHRVRLPGGGRAGAFTVIEGGGPGGLRRGSTARAHVCQAFAVIDPGEVACQF